MHKNIFILLLLGVFSISIQGCSSTRVYRLNTTKQSTAKNVKWTETSKTKKKWVTGEMCSQDFGEAVWLALPICLVIGVVTEPFRGWEKVRNTQVTGDINVNFLSPSGDPLPGLKVNDIALGADSKYNLAFSFSPGRVTETSLGTLSVEHGWEDKYNNGEVVLIPKPHSIRYDARLEGKHVFIKAIAEPNNILLSDPYNVVITTKTTFSSEARKRIADKIAADKAAVKAANRLQAEEEAAERKRVNSLISKYGKRVTFEGAVGISNVYDNPVARVKSKIYVEIPSFEISAELTITNLKKSESLYMGDYRPNINYYSSSGWYLLALESPDTVSRSSFSGGMYSGVGEDRIPALIKPGQTKTVTLKYKDSAHKLESGRRDGCQVYTDAEDVTKTDIVRRLLDNDDSIAVEILSNPNCTRKESGIKVDLKRKG